jgi:hypothetical protein
VHDANVDLDAAIVALRDAQDAEDAAKVRAAELVADARAAVADRRRELHSAIADAYRGGLRQKDLVERTGMTRESIRRILRAAGVEADE